MTQATRLTAEEFFLRPAPADGSQEELVRGEVVTRPLPGGLHGVVCNRVSLRLGQFEDMSASGGVTCSGTGFITARDPDTVRGPDVAYWSRERLPEVPVGYIEIPPDLIVEVLSPGNTSRQIRGKIQEYFARGVRVVWVIAPEDRTLTIYRTPDEGRLLHESATVPGDDVLPGFECRVADLMV